MPAMDLSSLARTLAERLHDVSIRCSHNNTESEWAFDCIKCTEAVIREAIEKTLTQAERAIEMIPVDHFKDIYSYIGRSDACRVIAELRDSLKPVAIQK